MLWSAWGVVIVGAVVGRWFSTFVPRMHMYSISFLFLLRSCAANPGSCRWRSGSPGSLRGFAAFSSTRGGPQRLFLPPPCPPVSTTSGEGLHGGLLDGSCGRRHRRATRNGLNVGTYAPYSESETPVRRRGGKTSIVHTITDKSMIRAVSIIR